MKPDVHFTRIEATLTQLKKEIGYLEYYMKYTLHPERYETLSARNRKALELLRSGDALTAELVLDGVRDNLLRKSDGHK